MTKQKSHGWSRGHGKGLVKRRLSCGECFTQEAGRQEPTIELWHYSKDFHLESILSSGVIRRATAGLPLGERAAVWLSAIPEWWRESGGTIVFRPVRFKLKTGALVLGGGEVVPWAEHRKNGGVPLAIANALESVGRKSGARPSDWWCSYDDIKTFHFDPPEVFDGKGWVTIHSGVVTHD